MPALLKLPHMAAQTAPHACLSCNLKKTRCDKALDRCGRCERLLLVCKYDYTVVSNRKFRVNDLDSDSTPKGEFSGSSSLYGSIPSSPSVRSSVSRTSDGTARSAVDSRAVAESYFQAVYPWLRVVDQDRFYALTEQRETAQSPHLQVLISCMELATRMPINSQLQTSMFEDKYQQVKKDFAITQASSTPSIELVQSGALLALFEHGHGNSAQARITLALTVAMADSLRVLPLDVRSGSQHLDIGLEIQNTNVWWALFILDKIVTAEILDKALPLLVQTPKYDYVLPIDASCIAWDELQKHLIYHGAPVAYPLNPCLRAAQAATLLHRTIEFIQEEPRQPFITSNIIRMSADRDLRTLIAAMFDQAVQWEIFCESFAMCIIALFILHTAPAERMLTPDSMPKNTEEQAAHESNSQIAISAIKSNVNIVAEISYAFNREIEKHTMRLQALPPQATNATARALKAHLWLSKLEPGDTSRDDHVKSIFRSLQAFSQRWDVGNQHISSLYGNLQKYL